MSAIMSILEAPAIAIIPRVESSHKIKNMPAISLKGEGSAPISHKTTANKRKSQRDIVLPEKVKSGVCNPPTGP